MCGWDNGSIGCLSLHFVSISERMVVLLLRSPWTIGDIPIGSLKKENRNWKKSQCSPKYISHF